MRIPFAPMAAALAAALLAGPAAAQPDYQRPLNERDVRAALPSPQEIESMGAAMDRMVGALMTIDIGPIIDAADPDRRNPDYGRPGRTLGEMGRRDDPYFDQRVRAGIRGATTGMHQMVAAFANVAPQLQRSIEEMSRAIDGAMRGIPRAPDRYYEPEPDYDYVPENDWNGED